VIRNTGRLNLVWGAAHGPKYALGDRRRNKTGNAVEPLGSVSVYLCALLSVIFMWDTSLTYNPAERP
jgi:hypothetical protein